MPLGKYTWAVAATSPASESVATAGTIRGLEGYDSLHIDADLVGATGGTLSVFLQRKIADDVWVDWARFPDLAAEASATNYSVWATTATTNGSAVAVGYGTDSTPAAPTIAANTFIGGPPGEELRVVFSAGASTSAGAAQTIRITGIALPR